MRNNVSFQCPEPFVPIAEVDDVLSVRGVDWFATLLRRIPALEVNSDFRQEDWGAVIFVSRHQKKFWIGLSMWPEGDHAWLAHVHHHSFAWLQRFSSSRNEELRRLIGDIYRQLSDTPAISEITWYRKRDMRAAIPVGSSSPNEK